MQFFTIRNAPATADDLVYRESWVSKLIGLLIAIAIVSALAWLAWRERSWGLGLMALISSLFPLLVGAALRHALHAGNWLVRVHPGGVLIKFRSYLNEHFSSDDTVVFELRSDEIAWVGKTVVRMLAPGDRGGVTASRMSYLDLKPKQDDLGELEARLKEERTRPAPGKFSQTKYHDYPVRVVEGGLIRITWASPGSRVTPGLNKALAQLEALLRLSVRPAQTEQLDLVTDPKDRALQEKMVLERIEAGDEFGAVRLVRKLYGYSLTEARGFVDDLQGRGAATPGESPKS